MPIVFNAKDEDRHVRRSIDITVVAASKTDILQKTCQQRYLGTSNLTQPKACAEGHACVNHCKQNACIAFVYHQPADPSAPSRQHHPTADRSSIVRAVELEGYLNVRSRRHAAFLVQAKQAAIPAFAVCQRRRHAHGAHAALLDRRHALVADYPEFKAGDNLRTKLGYTYQLFICAFSRTCLCGCRLHCPATHVFNNSHSKPAAAALKLMLRHGFPGSASLTILLVR